MNIRERLRDSYENVSFIADSTWSNTPNAYQKTNMALWLKEKQVQESQMEKNRPRSVREFIPNSKLAQYADFVYNESREMSYASVGTNPETIYDDGTEIWQIREVSALFKWFTKDQLEEDYTRYPKKHESPLMKVSGFEEKILKILITEDKVKDIWSKDKTPEKEQPKENTPSVNLFCSPAKSVYLANNNSQVDDNWFRNISTTRDHKLLGDLNNSFQEQNNEIMKNLTVKPEPIPIRQEAYSNEVLYSEVLQGLSPNRRIVSMRNDRVDEVCSNQEAFTNFTVLNSQKLYRDNGKIQQNAFLSQNNASVYLQTEQYRTITHIPTEVQYTPRPTVVRPDYITEAIISTPTVTTSASICSSTQIFGRTNWVTQATTTSTTANNTRYLGQAVTRRSCNFEQIEINEIKEEIVDNEIISEVRVQRRTRINPLTLNQLRSQIILQELQRQANHRHQDCSK